MMAWINIRFQQARANGMQYGNIPAIVLFGDINQLPPVGGKCILDTDLPQDSPANSDVQGKLSSDVFRTKMLQLTRVVRQDNTEFKNVLSNVRDGNCVADKEVYENRSLSHLLLAERQDFESNALFLYPTNREKNQKNLEYLQNLKHSDGKF